MVTQFSTYSNLLLGVSCWSFLTLQLLGGATVSASTHSLGIHQENPELLGDGGSPHALVPFNPPEVRRDNPDDELGSGGSPRPDCAGLSLPDEVCTAEIAALVPWSSEVGYFGYTTTNTPTFWIYIPYNAHDLTTGAIFELVDPEGESVTPLIQVDLSGTPGIIGIEMPPETVLSPGVRYTWYFELQITPSSGSMNPILIGTLERVDIDDIALGADPLDRARHFGVRGIWFDALTELMQVKDQYSETLDDFLRQADLGEIAQGR